MPEASVFIERDLVRIFVNAGAYADIPSADKESPLVIAKNNLSDCHYALQHIYEEIYMLLKKCRSFPKIKQ